MSFQYYYPIFQGVISMSSTTFRRTALSLALLTLPATAALAADALPQVKIAVNDKQ